jgi:hypothetical protein
MKFAAPGVLSPLQHQEDVVSKATVHFASVYADKLEPEASLPAKFRRALELYALPDLVKDKVVALKMHLGGDLGYTTVHPLFVRLLVQALKAAGGQVFVTDTHWAMGEAVARGYTPEVLGAPILPASGARDRYYYRHAVDYRTLKEIQVAGHIQDADVLINLSHAKGHGACGYGGACKNIAMGCVSGETRSEIHRLQGGMIWNSELCEHCGKCVKACRYGANKFNDKNGYEVNYDDCTYCQHCVNACPTGSLTTDDAGYKPFQEGMALCTEEALRPFLPDRALYVNVLMNITILCDCWGMSTPSLVPDIGIMVSRDIVAIEQATLDAIKTENLIPGTLPLGRQLRKGQHLFERIHGKDPFVQVAALERRGLGTRQYELIEVK